MLLMSSSDVIFVWIITFIVFDLQWTSNVNRKQVIKYKKSVRKSAAIIRVYFLYFSDGYLIENCFLDRQ